jgi:glycosyltransferase involved in cell wall biosynthesis
MSPDSVSSLLHDVVWSARGTCADQGTVATHRREPVVNRAVPPLTVGMPVHNGALYMGHAIESILGQTYGDFELLISDNCSTDGTEEICRSYAARDPRIIYDRLANNVGLAGNFNRVFQRIRSPLFKFAAHDDLCAPRFLEVCMNAFADAPDDLVLCFPSTIKIDEAGIQHGPVEDRLDLRQRKPHQRFRAFLWRHNLSNCLFGIFRSEMYGSTRLLQSFVAADVVLLGELALRGQFWKLPEPLFMRRIHAGMSGQANPTLPQLARYYDTSYRGDPVFYRVKMFQEFLRAIDTTPMTTPERLQCRQVLVSAWLPKYWIPMARELVTGAGKTRQRASTL